MEERTLYYDKPIGLILFMLYIPITIGLCFAMTLGGESEWYYICVGIGAALCAFFSSYLYIKWVSPALRNEAAIEINDTTIELKNKALSIAWTDIDAITCKAGEYGSVIGIKLKDIAAFLNSRGKLSKLWMYRLNYWIFRHHIGISTLTIKGSGEKTYETINDFFNRFRLGASAFYHKRAQI